MSGADIILVEDDDTLRIATVQALELAGFSVNAFDHAERALRHVTTGHGGCVVSDIRMAGMDGLELFARIRSIDAAIPVILVTGHGDVDMAVGAMRNGAFDFLTKPFSTDQLTGVVRHALNQRRLELDNRRLRQSLEGAPREELIARSRSAAHLQQLVAQVATTDIDLVIEGEAGSGKDSWVRQLHRQSVRHAGPLVVLGCIDQTAPLPLDDGAQRASGGILCLDRADRLSDADQARLVAMLDARDRARESGTTTTGFRLVATLPCPPAQTGWRDELALRLGSISIRVPPLRERRDDIPALFARFVREALDQAGRSRFDMTAADRKRLIEYDWPGNVRELRNYAFGAVLNLPRQSITNDTDAPRRDLASRVATFERMLICEALEATGGNVVRATDYLGTSRKTLYEKFGRYGINPADYRATRT